MRGFKRLSLMGVTVLGIVLVPGGCIVLYVAGQGFSELGAPSPVTPDRPAIVGTWSGEHGAQLAFSNDGSCVASTMPDIEDSGLDDLPDNGPCTWSIIPLGNDAGDTGGVDISSGNRVLFLNTTGNHAHPKLFVTIGDPDNADWFAFTKK